MESWEIEAKFCRLAPCGRQKTCGFYLGTFATPCQNALLWEQEVEGSIAHCQRQMEAPQRKAAGPKKKAPVRFGPYRKFGDRQYYLLASTLDKREAEKTKERAKIQGSLVRVVQTSVEGKPAYLVYVFRLGKTPEGQRKADRLNRGR